MNQYMEQPRELMSVFGEEDNAYAYYGIGQSRYQNSALNQIALIFPQQRPEKSQKATCQGLFNQDDSSSVNSNSNILDCTDQGGKSSGKSESHLKSNVLTRSNMQLQLSQISIERRSQAGIIGPAQCKNIGAIIHRMTSKFIQMKVGCRQIKSHEAKQACFLFCKGSANSGQGKRSLACFRALFEHFQLRQMCDKFYSSPKIVEQLMRGKASLKVKLSVLRHLQWVRKFCAGQQVKKWKQ